ncbi:MAG: tRNA (guanine37-N1)-methyltransferase [Patescibacteria group bacterium]|nr:tRNA (guanine37-N1)-methyltransferase [Patescibacteria group bacterium]
MRFHIVTLFPEVVEAYTNASILGRAQKEGLLKVEAHQLRDFVASPAKPKSGKGEGKWFYKRVDERPYGGGPGMVLQAEPFVCAVETIEKNISKLPKPSKTIKRSATSGLIYQSTIKATKKGSTGLKILITAAGGKPLTNEYAKKLSKQSDVIILCGRYEGIDARVKKILAAQFGKAAVEEVSVGEYILTGGEVPALAIIDATARQIPGVLGKIESLEEGRVASHDVYTRPEIIEHGGKKYRVPKILLSGHHAQIDTLRSKKRSKPL